MTKEYKLTIKQEAFASAVVRHGHVAHYTPEKTARYENLVKLTKGA